MDAIKSDIFELLAVCLLIFLTLVFAQVLKKRKKFSSELLRKLTHIITGIIIAFTPLFLSWSSIVLLSGAFFLTVLVSLKLNIFSSIHGVGRKTYGEILYPISIGLLAVFQPDYWVFMVAVLHLALADALAAIFGTKYGTNNQYKIFGGVKSLLGSCVFLVVSFFIVGASKLLFADGMTVPTLQLLLLLPVLVTIIEGLSSYGLDNFTVPVGVWLLIISLGS